MRFYLQTLFLTLALFAFRGAAMAVTANFTADHVSGCAPLVVHFTNSSTGATSYDWDLGNGTSILHLTDVSGSYLLPGTYTCKLTAYSGTSSSVKTMVITVFPAPTVSFTANDTAVCPGEPITFTSTTTGGVPGPITYTWNFGDGFNSTLPSPSHSYASPGYYNITLSATNAEGCVSSLTVPAYVHIYTPPTAYFSAVTTYFCNTPAHAVFNNLSTGTPPLRFTWWFGDMGTSTLTSPTHDYTSVGTYSVKLRVVDANGCSDSITRAGYIVVGLLDANFTAPATACVYNNVTFTNTSSSHTTSSWDYGDGGRDGTEHGSHTYSAPGTYTVRLIIGNGACFDTITRTIVIYPQPVATFTITPTDPCPAPATIGFTSTSPSGSSIYWKYGDGFTGTGGSSSHTYGSNGVKTIDMIVTSANGCKDTITQSFTIYDLIAEIPFTIDSEGCKPLRVDFSNYTFTTVPDGLRHPYPYGTSAWSWDFGDGSPTSTSPTPTHIYTAVGVYTARVRITTVNGCTAFATKIIRVGTPPNADFTAAPTHICADHIVNFINLSTGADSYLWIFGDGDRTSVFSPGHLYTIPGTYTDTLIAYFNGCPDTLIRTNYILVDSPKAIIHYELNCSPRTRVNFYDSSYGDDTHLWLFGDGDTSSLDNPIHDYPGLAMYTVKLATYNIRSGCRDTETTVVNLVRPVVTFFADDTDVCRDDIVNFHTVVTGGLAVQTSWYVESRWFGPYSDSNFIDTFNITGRYPMLVVIKDQDDCLDSAYRPDYITVAKPVANFTVAPPFGCWPFTTTFTDRSTDVTGVAFSSYLWEFGDGGTATVTSPSVTHTFTVAGVFTTTMTVTDVIGCKDTAELPLVTVYRPTASFSGSNLNPCPGDPVVFTNTSPGITGSYWMFGDGDTSVVTSPTHAYRGPGTYTVTLVVTDSHGCTDTARYVNYISVTKPTALFYMDDSTSICPPLLVNFTNISIGAIAFWWDLGDGSFSVVPSPSDLYTTPGLLNIKLVATNRYGCKDTAIGHVNIFGYGGEFTYAPLSGCAPLSVHFKAFISNVPSIIWDFADGNVSPASAIDSIDHIYTIPGAYVPKLILSDNTGCQNSSLGRDTIKVDAVTPGFTTVPNPVCLNAPMNYQDTSHGYWAPITSWYWTFTNGDTSTLIAPSYVYTAVGTYSVNLKVTDGWGCIGTVTKDIIVYPPPVIQACPDTTVCLTDYATLSAVGGVSYFWADATTLSCTACNPTRATPTAITTYTVTGVDEHGCKNQDTVTVYLKYKTVSKAYSDTEICRGVTVQLLDTGGTKYTWIPGTGLSSPNVYNPLASPDVTTRYLAIAQLAGCIPDSNYVMITVHQLPTVDAGPDQTLLSGSEAQITAKGYLVYKWAWGNGESLSCDSCSNPVATMSVTTTYPVTVYSDFGCVNSDTITIRLFCDQSQIFVPNTFTPNGDGQNDVFYPRGKGVSVIKSFRIYNRWGELLFERTNLDINDVASAWDGTYQGEVLKPDVYVYIVTALCDSGEPLSVKGDVTLIK